MQINLNNKVVMISGASSGIGKALAIEYIQRGYRVSLAARRDYLMEEFVFELLGDDISKQEIGDRVLIVKTDVSIEEDCKKWVEVTYKKFGRIDILINNAGVSMRSIFEECSLETLKRLMDVNFWGSTYSSHYALKYLLETKGSLVGISSVAGFQCMPGRSGYSASKAALQVLLDTIRLENKHKGLKVLVVCPWFVKSEIRKYALNRYCQAQGESPRNEGKMMTAEKVALYIIKAIEKNRRSLVLTFIGKLTIFVGKLFPRFTEMLSIKTMCREIDTPFKEN